MKSPQKRKPKPKTMEELTKGFEEFTEKEKQKEQTKEEFEKNLKKIIKKKDGK